MNWRVSQRDCGHTVSIHYDGHELLSQIFIVTHSNREHATLKTCLSSYVP